LLPGALRGKPLCVRACAGVCGPSRCSDAARSCRYFGYRPSCDRLRNEHSRCTACCLRHLIQHFPSGIVSLARLGIPLWGSLSWILTNRETGKTESFTIAPGTFFHGAAIPTCTFNSVEGKYVERVVLYAGSLKIDLADLVDHVTEFAGWYSEWFRQTHSSSDHHAADILIQLAVTPVYCSQSEVPTAPPAPK
jgi:hypothetical protein